MTRCLGFCDFAAAQAGSADAKPLIAALHLRVDIAQVHVPTPFRDVVGVADVISKLRPLAAIFAYLCHDCSEVLESTGKIDFTGISADPPLENAVIAV